MTLDPRVYGHGLARGQNLRHFQKMFFSFSVTQTISADSWSDISRPCDIDLCGMKWWSAWPILHGPVILPYILKTIWCMISKFLDNESVWCTSLTSNKCRSQWPIFHGPAVLPYILKFTWCINVMVCENESVWRNLWPQNKCGSQWPIFHSPVICCIFWRLFDVWMSYFVIMSQFDGT